MNILYLNIYDGCQEESRYFRLHQFILDEDPDVLCLLELNDWTSERKKKFISKIQLPYVEWCTTDTGYDLAIFSKKKFKYQKSITEGFHHGLVHVSFDEFNLFLVHLNPWGEELRQEEIKRIIGLMDDSSFLIGDLNSLSRKDNYDEALLLAGLKKNSLRKFGDEHILYFVYDVLKQNNIVDVFEKLKTQTPTVPTKINKDKAHFTKMRLDYLFAKSTALDLVLSAETIITTTTNILSDHYPLKIVLKS